jgi:hypothetical protein
MFKRRIYWPYGNPRFDAWELDSQAGRLIVRRNHPLVKGGERQCQGWDLWLNDKFLGAIGSRSLTELNALPWLELSSLARSACCGRHESFPHGRTVPSLSQRGGRRPNAGRKPRGDLKRIKLNTTIDQMTAMLIDRRRGKLSRGEFLDRLVQGRGRR